MRRAGSKLLALLLLGPVLAAPNAAATFHEMSIREVYPGSSTSPGAEYVELQMWASGQNLVGGHALRAYDKGGDPVATTTFPGDVAGAANQSTVLLATPAAETAFGRTPDAQMDEGQLDPAGGAVCWESLDCVSWGSFSGSLPSPAGSPATPSGIPDGMALRRTISPGCATLLEPTDDDGNSAVDFSAVFPDPRPNSVAPTEHACASAGSQQAGEGPGGKSGGGRRAPQTKLIHRPPRRSFDATASFRFAASESDARFQCRLDGRRFKSCRSPFSSKALRPGHHVFEVRARDDSGRTDPSPARCAFTVLARRR